MSLFWKQLYPPKRSLSEQPIPRVVLHSETRAKLCDILFHLVKHDPEKTKGLLESLESLVPFYDDDDDGMSCAISTSHPLTSKPDEPYLYELPYQFERLRALRAPCGYAGLLNLSNTCYLNSILAQLFMNTGFRQFILNSKLHDPANGQELMFYTQKLFGFMQESYRRFVDPTNLVSSIKTYDDTLIDIHSQMDVDEFYNLLFDRWEGQFHSHEEKRKLKSFYGGQLVQQVKSKECEHISERLEPFSAIQCDIKGKNTLEDSLQAYVDGEIMEGGMPVYYLFYLEEAANHQQTTSTSVQRATNTLMLSRGDTFHQLLCHLGANMLQGVSERHPRQCHLSPQAVRL